MKSSTIAGSMEEQGVSAPRIRITGVRVHSLRGRLRERFGWSLNWTDSRTATLVEVTTNAGLAGWGDGACDEALLSAQADRVWRDDQAPQNWTR